jgi:hypothetical protein
MVPHTAAGRAALYDAQLLAAANIETSATARTQIRNLIMV